MLAGSDWFNWNPHHFGLLFMDIDTPSFNTIRVEIVRTELVDVPRTPQGSHRISPNG